MTDGWTTPTPKQRIVARHVAQLTEAAGGVVGKGRNWRLTETNDTANYPLEVIQRDTTNGLIARFGYGGTPGGSPSAWTLSITKNGLSSGSFHDTGGAVFDVKAYGAMGDGATDDTAAILAARAAIVAQYNATFIAGVLFFPPGVYYLNQPLIFQTIGGVTIRGCGPNVSILKIADRGDDWAGLHVVDFANSSNCSIEHMDIRNDLAGLGNLPDTLVLYAQGTGNGSNANRMENVRLQGAVRRALWYNYAVPSCQMYGVDFYLEASNQAILDNDTANVACVILTRDNVLGLTASNGLSLLTPGSGQMGNIKFEQCEIHDVIAFSRTEAGTATASTLGQAVWLDEAYEILFDGKNISSAGGRYVRLTGAAAALSGIGCRGITFRGVQFYSEGATALTALFPVYGVELNTAPVSVTSPTTAVRNLTITDCYIPCRGSTATASVIQGVEAAAFYAPTLKRWSTQASYTGRALSGAGAGIVVEDPDIEANNCAVVFGSAGTSTRGQRLHYATSTVTAASETHGMYQLPLGGAISLAGGGTAYYGIGASTTDGNVQFPVSQACRVRNLRVSASTSPGSGASLTVTLRKNGTDMTTSMAAVTISGANTTDRNIAGSVNFAEGDLLSIKVVSSATAATVARISAALSVWDA